MSPTRRLGSAAIIVAWIVFYICVAWILGAQIPGDAKLLQLAYYPVAGIIWVPVTFMLMKRLYSRK
ncbi:DUF2842 domain-containing protein [Aestuariispira ectoiniformans]|uniref:DUF2842 domain-containing protein n=1 Tax=Aestuariispira ectoiniformans TaxID=2775080 RepID=UPI0035CD06C2